MCPRTAIRPTSYSAKWRGFGSGVQVLALLSGNDPDLILRCLRAGAIDFLIQPFTAEQFEAALAKVARAAALRRVAAARSPPRSSP